MRGFPNITYWYNNNNLNRIIRNCLSKMTEAEYRLLPKLIRLPQVSGVDTKCNDIVYGRPLQCEGNTSLVIFFCGDVQDFTENMNSHRDNRRYTKWNLESTAQLLKSKFEKSHIIVVRPSRMELGTFSCFRNFVPCNSFGVPEHEPSFNSICHLDTLIKNVVDKLKHMPDDEIKAAEAISLAAMTKNDCIYSPNKIEESDKLENIIRSNVCLDLCDIHLIGFSKGCVVLNQFLYEFDHYKNDLPTKHFINRIKNMFWLDGGHNGGKNTWITSTDLLHTLVETGIRVHIHVSPYQIKDDRRPWIGKEEKSFYETLKKKGSDIKRVVHFKDLPPDLNLHFEILKVFTAF